MMNYILQGEASLQKSLTPERNRGEIEEAFSDLGMEPGFCTTAKPPVSQPNRHHCQEGWENKHKQTERIPED
jgi:hypothetical protein